MFATIVTCRFASIRLTYSSALGYCLLVAGLSVGVVTEQHVVTLTRADGFAASSDVCAVIRFDDNGLITRIDEYFDSAAFGPLLS